MNGDASPATPASGTADITMSDLRRQAVSLALQLWDQYGVHPVHIQYKPGSGPGHQDGVQATVSNAADQVTAAAGDAYTVLARSVSAAPEYTHFVCIPHTTADGEMLVVAEGGGSFHPGAYRIAVHPTLQAEFPAGANGMHQVGMAVLDEETGFFYGSAALH